jgi:hypothetical protein
MHLEITSESPGDCPICHMALEPAAALAREATTAAANVTEEAKSISRALSLPPEASDLVRYSIGLVRGHVLPQEIYAPARAEANGFVMASMYKDESLALADDESVRFIAASAPSVVLDARRTSDGATPWDRSTVRVRFRLASTAHAPPEGEPGFVVLSHKPRKMLVVPAAAVLESPEGPFLLVYSSADRTFSKRPVEIGKVFSGLAAVVSGVKEREVIVAMNAFFLDAERRLKNETDRRAEGKP